MDAKIREELQSLAEEEYRKFSGSLVPGKIQMLGVRLPELRKIAKRIAREDFEQQIYSENIYFEEKMLKGMIIGYATMKDKNVERGLKYLDEFAPEVDNWSVCDSFCNTFQVVRNDLEKSWNHIQKYIDSQEEFQVRIGLILLLNHFVKCDKEGKRISRKRRIEYSDLYENGVQGLFEDRMIGVLNRPYEQGYYAMMAAAWTTAEMFVTYPKSTYQLLLNHHMDDVTFHKSIQKICESLTPTKEVKQIMRGLRNEKEGQRIM